MDTPYSTAISVLGTVNSNKRLVERIHEKINKLMLIRGVKRRRVTEEIEKHEAAEECINDYGSG